MKKIIILSVLLVLLLVNPCLSSQKIKVLIYGFKSLDNKELGNRENKILTEAFLNYFKKKPGFIPVSQKSTEKIREAFNFDLPSTLLQTAKDAGVDIIVMGKYGKSDAASMGVFSMRESSGIGKSFTEISGNYKGGGYPTENEPAYNKTSEYNKVDAKRSDVLRYEIVSGYSGEIIYFGLITGTSDKEFIDGINAIEIPIKKAKVISVRKNAFVVGIGSKEGVSLADRIKVFVRKDFNKEYELLQYDQIEAKLTEIEDKRSIARPENIADIYKMKMESVVEIVHFRQ